LPRWYEAAGGFSLLFQGADLAVNKSDKPIILTNDSDGRKIIQRPAHPDLEEQMPYKHPQYKQDK
jgi:hypothetical protein